MRLCIRRPKARRCGPEPSGRGALCERRQRHAATNSVGLRLGPESHIKTGTSSRDQIRRSNAGIRRSPPGRCTGRAVPGALAAAARDRRAGELLIAGPPAGATREAGQPWPGKNRPAALKRKDDSVTIPFLPFCLIVLGLVALTGWLLTDDDQ